MQKLMNTDRYCELVKQVGIEQAYQMRHRGTGRTTRAALRAAADISEGKNIVVPGAAGTMHMRHDFIRLVRIIIDNLGVQCAATAESVHVTNAGRIVTTPADPNSSVNDGFNARYYGFTVLREI